jgi:hypothetical protein
MPPYWECNFINFRERSLMMAVILAKIWTRISRIQNRKFTVWALEKASLNEHKEIVHYVCHFLFFQLEMWSRVSTDANITSESPKCEKENNENVWMLSQKLIANGKSRNLASYSSWNSVESWILQEKRRCWDKSSKTTPEISTPLLLELNLRHDPRLL